MAFKGPLTNAGCQSVNAACERRAYKDAPSLQACPAQKAIEEYILTVASEGLESCTLGRSSVRLMAGGKGNAYKTEVAE